MAGYENLFVSWNECDTDAESLQVVNLAAGVPSLSKESQTVFIKSKIVKIPTFITKLLQI